MQCYISNPKLYPNWFLIKSLLKPLHWGGMNPTQDPLPESRQCIDSSREGHFELVSSFEKQGTWTSFQRFFDFFFISVWLKNNKGLCLKVYKVLQVIINLEYLLLNINLHAGETHHWLLISDVPAATFSPLLLCVFKTHGAAWLRGTFHLNQGHWRNHCLSLESSVVDAIIDSGILPVLRWPTNSTLLFPIFVSYTFWNLNFLLVLRFSLCFVLCFCLFFAFSWSVIWVLKTQIYLFTLSENSVQKVLVSVYE